MVIRGSSLTRYRCFLTSTPRPEGGRKIEGVREENRRCEGESLKGWERVAEWRVNVGNEGINEMCLWFRKKIEEGKMYE